jgi:hypothetical protein
MLVLAGGLWLPAFASMTNSFGWRFMVTRIREYDE